MKALRGVATLSPVELLPRHGAQVRIYIIGQQMLVAKALGNVLQQDDAIVVVGDATVAEASRLEKASPNLILLDSDTSFDRLADTIGTCRSACPTAKIGVLSGHLSSAVMQRAFSAGADGYIVKDITPDALIMATKAMAGGNLYVDPRMVGLILRKDGGIGRRDPSELSPRESDIVRLIAAGLSNREISTRLSLSDKTIKNHISHIFAKLNLTARTQVVIYAMRKGLV